LLLAYWLISALIALAPTTIPRLDEISIDGRTLAFTLGVSLLTSPLFGLVPALRISKPDLNVALREGSRSTSGSSGAVRSTLVIAEIALTLVLLIGAGLLIKSLWRVLEVNPGFSPEHVLTMDVSLPASEYSDSNRKIVFYRQLFERLKSLPGLDAAGMINNLPMGGVDLNGQLPIAGRPIDQAGYASFRVVARDYFLAMNIPLVNGRYFTEQSMEEVTLMRRTLLLALFTCCFILGNAMFAQEPDKPKSVNFASYDFLQFISTAGNSPEQIAKLDNNGEIR
jgi:hypothetical protein